MTSDTASYSHSHVFDEGNPLAESRTAWAAGITAVMMVIEITAGWLYQSMALLADGWHMSSHALALGLSVAVYAYARKHAQDRRFTFGTWKVEVLGGYTSAVLLMGVAFYMAWQSVERLLSPVDIDYDRAIAVGAVGLVVNLVCAWLLKDAHGHDHGHGHGHGHSHGHDHGHAHTDLNLRAAYLHVVADAATSVLAIVALFGGKWWGAVWLDPLMGIAGAVLVAVWAWGLLRQSGSVLLDANGDAPVAEEIREAVATLPVPADITDLHVWQVGKGKFACIVAVVTDQPLAPDVIRRAIGIHEELVHITVEVNRRGAPA
ncbi:CDF family Co(II)/Ni(II) efflux transporter DmeF [Pigmentiphaga litoralis]|uniref:CDF family Co(II)/Ni(II) efflux transporter DmeF n=1 Tax=Pigmentiphaga litoralis TaxID=516702 RepID=UPI00359C82B5